MDTRVSRFRLSLLRFLLSLTTFCARGLAAAGARMVRAARRPTALAQAVKAVVIKGYDGIRHARRLARALHPEGRLRVLLIHPATLRFLTVCVFGAVILYNFATRPTASEDLERASILYRLISAEASAITVETALTRFSLPASATHALERQADGEQATADSGEHELAFLTPSGALLKPNPAFTRRGSRPRDEIVRYTVQQDDTISSIAYRYNLTARSMLWANNLTANSYIRPGDSLVVPQTDGVVHTIQKGDTLEKIAARYRSTVEKISEVNRLAATATLELGRIITVPDGVPQSYGRSASVPRVVARPSAPVSSQRAAARGGGGFIWPTTGRVITQYFSWRHSGLDIDGTMSSPIFAAADGTVEAARGGWNGGYGNVIVIDHGKGIKTRYGHLSRLSVKTGDKVKGGQVIGIMGSTGRSTGSHLHFEVMIGGGRKNPLSYL